MPVRLRAEDEPPRTRLDYWQHVLGQTSGGFCRCRADPGYRGRMDIAGVGPLTTVNIRTSALESSRTPDLAREPELGFKVEIGIRGSGRYEQDGRQHRLMPGDFHLIDRSRTSQVTVDTSHDVSIVLFPRELLPVRDQDLRSLTLIRFSADDPYAALVAATGREMAGHLGAYESAGGARVGTAMLDLLTVAIATRLDRVSAVPPGTREQAMMIRIQDFIERHLGDPGLSPGAIAAAHYISVRTLHKLYQSETRTVAASIRHKRLERCRQDLLDPALAGLAANSIGTRWGYPESTTFIRAFRTAYGLPPGEYRIAHTAPDSPLGGSFSPRPGLPAGRLGARSHSAGLR